MKYMLGKMTFIPLYYGILKKVIVTFYD